ncbi:galactosyltransferase-related protein [Chitinophaga sp. RAB17]|uniref:galactosyltransferase-related protein n=1 Tax=Chitinophaga sp. RAB17 TaxID=3233049 RepID=UPI003F93CCF1
MIYLSAMPDTDYFVWQVEVQLLNFSGHGIPKDCVHIVIGYNESIGINKAFLQLEKDHKEQANFFFYPDRRISRKYVSSIRPHILWQHFEKHPLLKEEVIFYHDSDIIFTTSLPDFEKFSEGDIWYVSNTRNYISLDYLLPFGKKVVEKMCEIVNIDFDTVLRNDANAGGAQYVMKNIDADFWRVAEGQCEDLFKFLNGKEDDESLIGCADIRPKTEFQAWCADMWVILWNGYKRATVVIDSSLDFCWPHEPQASWDKKHIFHNAGVMPFQKELLFCKSLFTEVVPYHKRLTAGSFGYCGDNYLALISRCAENRLYDATDVTFLLLVRIDSAERLENLRVVLAHIHRYFNTKIFLLEADSSRKVPEELVNIGGIEYFFIQDNNPVFDRTLYTNTLASMANTRIIVKCDADIIVSPDQLYRSIISVRYEEVSFSYPFDGTVMNVTGYQRDYFINHQSVSQLFQYFDALDNYGFSSVGGCIVSNRKHFLEAGGENEKFQNWGHEDQELFIRYRMLGYKNNREKGPIFHLWHPRNGNSYYSDKQAELGSYREYCRVSSMTNEDLKKEVEKWDTTRRTDTANLLRK